MALYAIQQSTTTWKLLFPLILASDHISPATGKAPTVTLSKNGAAFGAPAGAVTELANGWYQVAGNATDTNTLGPLLLHATEAASDPTDCVYEVVAYNPQDAAALGLTRLDAAITSRMATFTLPTNFSSLVIDATGNVKIQSGIKKNTALAKFEFLMTDSTTHAPVTGKAVTVTRSIDNGAFAAGTLSAVTEIGVGIYSVDFGAGDLNGGVITLHATAAGCDDLDVTIIPDP